MPTDVLGSKRRRSMKKRCHPSCSASRSTRSRSKAKSPKRTAVFDEYARAISLGVTSEEKYGTFVAKMKAAGADKIMAEMQKQIDAWKATK